MMEQTEYEKLPEFTRLKTGTVKLEDYVNIEKHEEIISTDGGYTVYYGRESGKIKNIAYLIEHKITKERYYKVTCNSENNIFTRISCIDMEYIKNMTPRLCLTLHKATGYVIVNGIRGDNNRYLHDIILRNAYPDDIHADNKLYSVDHYPNTHKLDNRRTNLRWATQSEQNYNRGKKARSKTAQPLPEGLTQSMIPKYVSYYKECYNKEKILYREFFKIEKHPNLETPRCGSKSAKFTWREKLDAIIEILYNINHNIVDENPNKLPMYYRVGNVRNAPHLQYEKRVDGKRLSLIMKMKAGEDVSVELERFNEKLYKKYPELSSQSIM
jgi:hypothetical protein